jgi:glycosyltransferase involved in cell wall biosynthesis
MKQICKPLRAVHIIAGLEAGNGGPSYTVPRLCEALAAVGADITLLSVAGTEDPYEILDKDYRDRRFPCNYARIPILRDLRCSSSLASSLHRIALTTGVIHNHGLWLIPNIEAGKTAAYTQKPLIMSPRGMLSPEALAFSRMKKRLFWRFIQGRYMRQASCIHATSEREYQDIRALGLTNPISIITNGVDLPRLDVKLGEKKCSNRVVLSLGRIHPIKGLDRLIHAWARIESIRPDWRLRIIGPSEAGHYDHLRGLANSLRTDRVSIEGPVYGHEKDDAYRQADLFVLPSKNENFGLAVAEALAARIPVICTKGAPWSGLEAEGCGWWLDHGVEPLAAALAKATSMSCEVLAAMGEKGRDWMARDFSWDRIARQMADVYRWMVGLSDAPSTIRFD